MAEDPQFVEVRSVQVAEAARVDGDRMVPVVLLYVRTAATPDQRTAFVLPSDIAAEIGGHLQEFAEKASWGDTTLG